MCILGGLSGLWTSTPFRTILEVNLVLILKHFVKVMRFSIAPEPVHNVVALVLLI